jgi:hypothetical protein
MQILNYYALVINSLSKEKLKLFTQVDKTSAFASHLYYVTN